MNMVHLWMGELSTEIFCCWMTRQCIFFGTLYKLLHVGSCIFWGTVDWYIGCYVGQHLVDSRPRCQSGICWVSTDILVKWCFRSCRSTDRPTVGQDSIGSLSAMYRWIVGRVSVKYQWCISRQFASPTIGRYIDQVMFTFGRVSAIKSVDSQPQ